MQLGHATVLLRLSPSYKPAGGASIAQAVSAMSRPVSEVRDAPLDDPPVWVLDDFRGGGASAALGIAERLGVPFRRIPLTWNWMAGVAGFSRRGTLIGLAQPGHGREDRAPAFTPAVSLLAPPPGGEGPRLVICATARAASVALWLKSRFACHVVYCPGPGPLFAPLLSPLGGLLRPDAYDMLVVPAEARPGRQDSLFPVLGAPHRVSPLVLQQAGNAWAERLSHLPRPHVALLVGGPVRGTDMPPAMAHALARKVGRLALRLGGSVLATTSRRTGAEASDALAAGLSRTMHLLYRWGEPGANPYLGFLADADAIVVTADATTMLSEACASEAAVHVALPELAGPRQRRLVAALAQAGQVRPLRDELSPWPRPRLDEAGRIAAEIRRRFPLD
jgi:mitochondrial fission protein ELM1